MTEEKLDPMEVATLLAVGAKMFNQRICQLIQNALHEDGWTDPDNFNVPDRQLLNAVRMYMGRHARQ